ncbi:MAG: tetratricopeptide repeat protein [Acidobacteriota bacterium]
MRRADQIPIRKCPLLFPPTTIRLRSARKRILIEVALAIRVALYGLLLAVVAPAQAISDDHFARGLELEKAGRLEEAVAEYTQSVKINPQFPVLNNLGAAYAKMGRLEDAIKCYEQALTLAPGHTFITLNLGLAHYKIGNFQRAAELFEQVIKAQPSHYQALLLEGSSLFQLGEYRRVIECLEPHESRYSQDKAFAYLLGTAYLREKQTEKGQRLVDRILREGDTAEAHLMLGTALAEINENRKSIAEFERARELNPTLPMVHSSLALALVRSGDREGARELFEEELKVNPNDFTANFYVGFLTRRENKDEEALPFLQKALQLRPDNGAVLFQISLVHFQRQELDRAQEILESLVQRFPDYIDAQVMLARVYYRKKMKNEGDRVQQIVQRLRLEQQSAEPGSQKSLEVTESEVTGREIEAARPKP